MADGDQDFAEFLNRFVNDDYDNLSDFSPASGASSGAEEVGGGIEVGGVVLPYRFEPDAPPPPPAAAENAGPQGPQPRPERVGNTEWCTCGNCVPMPKWEECVCCHEPEEVVKEMRDRAAADQIAINCLLDHPGFEPVCLNKDVLKVAYYAYRQHFRRKIDNENDQSRYLAYRQLTRMCWGYLGWKVRVPLPSCAVNCIHTHYPSADGRYTGFNPA